MTFSFNLIEEPWIPCITLDGELVTMSLHGLFNHAHELREISCETPLMTAAMYPMILALLHRVFGPESRREWRALMAAGRFDMSAIEAYLEQWYDRFDLFHPEYPFYQAHDDRVKVKSVIHIIHSIGNTGTLFTHETDEKSLNLSPAEAAIQLVTAQSFRTAGLSGLKQKFTDGNYARGVIFWAIGDNIFETCMLNLIAYPSSLNPIPHTELDIPTWEQAEPYKPREFPYGYLDYLTWMNNRIELQPEALGGRISVRQMTIAPGLTMSAEVLSPQKQYFGREDKKRGYVWSFLYFDESKDLWRDYHSLINLSDEHAKSPVVLQWLSTVAEDDVVRLSAMGMLAQQAKPIFYRHTRMPLPTSLLTDVFKQDLVNQAVESASEVANKLKWAIDTLAERILMRGGDDKPDKVTRNNLVQQWDGLSVYWGGLEPHFWDFIVALSQDDTQAIDTWHDILMAKAHEALDDVMKMTGTDAFALRAQVDATRILNSSLKKLFDKEQ